MRHDLTISGNADDEVPCLECALFYEDLELVTADLEHGFGKGRYY